jgi:pimeloyl-ACP methyl ester carboxylesterase
LRRLSVERLGSGPPVLLVHGSVSGGASTWAAQRVLAERFTLLVADRPGYGQTPMVEKEDFEVDAALVADALGECAHLVGHSYGGVVSLLAAALRPRAVRSLTVIEPPAFGVARANPAVAELVQRLEAHWDSRPTEPEPFLRGFLEIVGSAFDPPSPLPSEFERGARILLVERPPWEAQIPLARLAAASYPILVVSGAHHAGFEAVCDVLEAKLGAERAVIPGAGHSVQRTGAPFNDRLEHFLSRAV